MADPFSIVAGALSIADVSTRLIKFLKDVKEGVETIDRELDDILHEIESLKTVNDSIKHVFERELEHDIEESDVAKEASTNAWREIATVLKNCEKTLLDFDALLVKIFGNTSSKAPAALNSLRRTVRKMMKEDELASIRQKLSAFHRILQLMLTAVNM